MRNHNTQLTPEALRVCVRACVCGPLKKVFASSRLQDDKTLNYFSTPQKNKTQIQNTYTFFWPQNKSWKLFNKQKLWEGEQRRRMGRVRQCCRWGSKLKFEVHFSGNAYTHTHTGTLCMLIAASFRHWTYWALGMAHWGVCTGQRVVQQLLAKKQSRREGQRGKSRRREE